MMKHSRRRVGTIPLARELGSVERELTHLVWTTHGDKMLDPYPHALSELTNWLLWGAVLAGLVLLGQVGHASEVFHGKASYYTVTSCQREGTSSVLTANGEKYDEMSFTCALPSHQFGSIYRICTPTHVCVNVRHNDYGPGRKPRARGVVVDLTPAAFAKLAPLRQGMVAVTVERVE